MRPRTVSRLRSWLAALLSLSAVLAFGQGPEPVPAPSRYFNDFASLVDVGVANRLNFRLEAYEKQSSNQVLVAIFPKLPEGAILEEYANKTFKSWKVGGKKDNGVVLFIFTEEDHHKTWIEVGYGLEGKLPDSICASILANQIKPAFKAGNYATGLEQGIEAIIQATKGEYQGTGNTVYDGPSSSSNMIWIYIVLFVIFVIWLNMGDTVFQRTGRFVLWNVLDVLRFIAISSMQGGGGGGSSGGFSGGGGRSGGGGASGDW